MLAQNSLPTVISLPQPVGCFIFFLDVLGHSIEQSEQLPSSFSGLLPPLVPSGRVECQSTSWKWEEDSEDPGPPSCSTLTSSGTPRLPCKQDDLLWDHHKGITHVALF